jgi:3-deoxy-D-manno-octulosonate 8-phosphate phosphatase (KDO 8-P phosphatase)
VREIDGELLERARRVRALALDVDGVLTDASLLYGRGGETLKRFSARDGFGIKVAQMEGLMVAVLSGRVAPPVQARLDDLGVPRGAVIQGSLDKGRGIRELASRLGVELTDIAFLGDDVPDLPALAIVGLAACPADAAAEVRARCHLVTGAPGGRGAVRELVEVVLTAQGRWHGIVESWGRGEVPPGFGDRARDTDPSDS